MSEVDVIEKSIVVHELSGDSLTTLRGLVGSTIHTIFATNLDAAGGHLAAWKLSMLLGKDSFVTFECAWHETPFIMMDSWEIDVRAASQALGIAVTESGTLISPSTISIYESGPIEKIEVYRFSEEHKTEQAAESVVFDGALVFCCEQKEFVIGCSLNGPGIAEYLHFSEDARVIRKLINGAERRLALNIRL